MEGRGGNRWADASASAAGQGNHGPSMIDSKGLLERDQMGDRGGRHHLGRPGSFRGIGGIGGGGGRPGSGG